MNRLSEYVAIIEERKSPKLKDLIGTDLVGGTLVEYVDEARFTRESSRGTILAADIGQDHMEIEASNVRFVLNDFSWLIYLNKQKGVFYLAIEKMPNYAIAPEGIEIPRCFLSNKNF